MCSKGCVVYFLIEGKIVFIYDDRIPFKEMVKGSYFGEGDILFQRKRLQTAHALVDSHALTLSKQMFESLVVPEYPEIVEEMRKVARERDKRFAEAERQMRKYVGAHCPNVKTIFDDSENEGKRKHHAMRRGLNRDGSKINPGDDRSEVGSRSEAGSSNDYMGKTGIPDLGSAVSTPQNARRQQTNEATLDRATGEEDQTRHLAHEELKISGLGRVSEEEKSFQSACKELETQLPPGAKKYAMGRRKKSSGGRSSRDVPKGQQDDCMENKLSESSDSSNSSQGSNNGLTGLSHNAGADDRGNRPISTLKKQVATMRRDVRLNNEKQKVTHCCADMGRSLRRSWTR